MSLDVENRVWVNIAPFIGSVSRSEQTILCAVIASDAQRVLIRTLPPHRELTMWVESRWIESRTRRGSLVSAQGV